MNIAILCNGPRVWASSRLRGYWLEDAAPLVFSAYGPGDDPDLSPDVRAVIFQKRFKDADVQRAHRYKAEGKHIIFDLTDPMWWWYPREVDAMLALADVVTTSNPGLTRAVEVTGKARRVATIPDRILPSFHPTAAQHGPRERTVFVWYGDSGNRVALAGHLPLLGYLSNYFPLELRIVDNDPGVKVRSEDHPALVITHLPWTLETVHAQLVACDIAWLPPYPGPWGLLKSNNKAVTAGWCGLPVVRGDDTAAMATLIEQPEERARQGADNRQLAERDYDIAQSVEEWQALVRSLEEPSPAPDGHKEAEHAAV